LGGLGVSGGGGWVGGGGEAISLREV